MPITTSTDPSAKPVDDLSRLCDREESRKHLNAQRVGCVALGERLEVLLGEQRRRDEDGGLVTVLHRLEHGAHGHLGLAEADVAANEAVHRHGPFHVRLDIFHRLQLVRGLGVGKGLLELCLPGRVGGEGVSGGGVAPPVELDQLLGHLAARRPARGLFGVTTRRHPCG